MKRCSRCKIEKPFSNFSSDRTRKDGYTIYCKICKGNYDRKTYPITKKNKIDLSIEEARKLSTRILTKKIYKGQKFSCAVLSCNMKGELHHIDYEKAEEVIPLCRKHHSRVHHLELIFKKVRGNHK